MKQIFSLFVFITASFLLIIDTKAQNSKHPLTIEDIIAFKRLKEVRVSPDDKWVAFTITSIDTVNDVLNTQIWKVSAQGGEPIQVTSNEYSASSPRWSPDGKCLSFMAAIGENAKTQLWKVNFGGGEIQQVSKIKQGIIGYEWSPDSKRLLLIIKDPKPSDLTESIEDDNKPLPFVIDRVQFKIDGVGYLDGRRDHIYVFNLQDNTLTQITSRDYDDSEPKWSPDGKSIAFVSNRSENPDLNYNSDIFIISTEYTKAGDIPRKLTTNPSSDNSPEWSPDGKTIVYTTRIDEKIIDYATFHLAVVDVNSCKNKVLTQEINRYVSNPRFSPEGKNILFIMMDSGEQQLASISVSGESFKRILQGRLTVKDFSVNDKSVYVLLTNEKIPSEIYKLQNNELNRLTKINDNLINNINFGKTEKIKFQSKDGTWIEGFIIKPNNFDSLKKYPLVMWIHGGPMWHFSSELDLDWFRASIPHLVAAKGYVALMINPRGSIGYGQDFCSAIFADWGNKDYEDVMAGVDYMISQGFIDDEKLGVGGGSYGGFLTNTIITKTNRFKAAVSICGISNLRASFGHDHWIKVYLHESGIPWENKDLMEKLSPINHVEKITTPTLWMVGAEDLNCPAVHTEQMFVAMKLLGQETQLVIHPGEYHYYRRPSFQLDMIERFFSWFEKYL